MKIRSIPLVRSWTAMLVLVVLVAGPSIGHASIIGDLNSVFLSNATPPTPINTKDRMGYSFGNLAVRAPVKSINVIAFDPPRVAAGCGGIDIHMGSFSFINGQQIVDTLRAVAANAAGLAFQAAISAISPSLSDLMKHFQALMQSMNNLAKNSCQLAHLMVDPFEKDIHDAVEGSGSAIATTFGISSDVLKSWDDALVNGTAQLNKLGQKNPKVGNGVWKAVMASGATGGLVVAGFPGLNDDPLNPNSMNNRLLVSIFGYRVTGVGCANQNNDGTPDASVSGAPAGTPAAQVSSMGCGGRATLNLNDIRLGGGQGSTRPDEQLTIYECADPNGSGDATAVDPQICLKVTRRLENFQGVLGWSLAQIKGNPEPDIGPTPNSILGKLMAGGSFTPDAAQTQFIRASQLPIGLLAKTSDPLRRQAVALRLAEYAADCYTAKIGMALYSAGRLALRDEKYSNLIPPEASANLASLLKDAMTMQRACQEDTTTTSETLRLINAAQLATATH